MGEGAWLVAFLLIQRLAELVFARSNTARLRAKGAVEFGASHYPLLILLHASWLIGLWVFGHDRAIVWPWLAVFVLLQIGRLWVIASLGRRWTTRVIVLRGASPVTRGPYRWIRHPNYLDCRAGNRRGSAGARNAGICADLFRCECGPACLPHPHRERSSGLGRAGGMRPWRRLFVQP